YTNTSQSTLSTSNLPETPVQLPKRGSSIASMRTNPSTHPMDLSKLPNPAMPLPSSTFPVQVSRMNPSFSANDIPSLTGQHYGNFSTSPTFNPRPVRPSSMIFNPTGLSQPLPQPLPSPSEFRIPVRRDSVSHIDGSEPRMFPGVVSSRRRSSVQQR